MIFVSESTTIDIRAYKYPGEHAPYLPSLSRLGHHKVSPPSKSLFVPTFGQHFFIPSITGQPPPNDTDREMFALPTRLSGLGLQSSKTERTGVYCFTIYSGPLKDSILKQKSYWVSGGTVIFQITCQATATRMDHIGSWGFETVPLTFKQEGIGARKWESGLILTHWGV